jgi:hypothetical protein
LAPNTRWNATVLLYPLRTSVLLLIVAMLGWRRLPFPVDTFWGEEYSERLSALSWSPPLLLGVMHDLPWGAHAGGSGAHVQRAWAQGNLLAARQHWAQWGRALRDSLAESLQGGVLPPAESAAELWRWERTLWPTRERGARHTAPRPQSLDALTTAWRSLPRWTERMAHAWITSVPHHPGDRTCPWSANDPHSLREWIERGCQDRERPARTLWHQASFAMRQIPWAGSRGVTLATPSALDWAVVRRDDAWDRISLWAREAGFPDTLRPPPVLPIALRDSTCWVTLPGAIAGLIASCPRPQGARPSAAASAVALQLWQRHPEWRLAWIRRMAPAARRSGNVPPDQVGPKALATYLAWRWGDGRRPADAQWWTGLVSPSEAP